VNWLLNERSGGVRRPFYRSLFSASDAPGRVGGKGVLRIVTPLLAGLCLFGNGSPAHADFNRETIAFIECTTNDGKTLTGSGVVVSSSGHILTANHIFKKRAPDTVRCEVQRGTAARPAQAIPLQYKGNAKNKDAAIFQIIPGAGQEEYPYLRYCEVGPEHSLQSLYSLGFPAQTTSLQLSIREGILSTTFPNINGLLETDAMTTAGMSGGGVVLSGTNGLIGIVIGFEPDRASGTAAHYGILPVASLDGDLRDLMEDAPVEECAPSSHARILGAQLQRLETAREGLQGKVTTLMALAEQIRPLLPYIRPIEEHNDPEDIDRFSKMLADLTSVMEEGKRTHPKALDKRLSIFEQEIDWKVEKKTGEKVAELKFSKSAKTDVHVDTVDVVMTGTMLVRNGQVAREFSPPLFKEKSVSWRSDDKRDGTISLGNIEALMEAAAKKEISRLKEDGFEDFSFEKGDIRLSITYRLHIETEDGEAGIEPEDGEAEGKSKGYPHELTYSLDNLSALNQLAGN